MNDARLAAVAPPHGAKDGLCRGHSGLAGEAGMGAQRSTLTPGDVEAIAASVAEREREILAPRLWFGLADVAEVARRLLVYESWVYAHADELGAIRLGDGEKARLRFDLEGVAHAIGATQPERSKRGARSAAQARADDRGTPDRAERQLSDWSGYDRRMPRPRTGTVRRQQTKLGTSYLTA